MATEVVTFTELADGKYSISGRGFSGIYSMTLTEIQALVDNINARLGYDVIVPPATPVVEIIYTMMGTNSYKITGAGYNYVLNGSEEDAIGTVTELTARTMAKNSKSLIATLYNDAKEIYELQLEGFDEISKDTFQSQRKEALDWEKTKDTESPAHTPIIDMISSARGVDRITLIGKILGNVMIQMYSVGRIQYYEDIIKGATTLQDLAVIAYDLNIKKDIYEYIASLKGGA